MKRALRVILALAFIIAFFLFVFFLAKRSRANLEAALPLTARTVLISPSIQEESFSSDQILTPSSRARILLLWDEVLLNAIDMNLDEDLELEQVLIVREQSTQTGIISIIVADYSTSTGSYYRVWKGESLATKPNLFVVQPRDLVGDGSIDLLCFGLDEKNLQTLTVFKPSYFAMGIEYKKVFSGSGLSIRVEEEADAQEEAEESIGIPSAQISVFASAGNEASPLDQIRLIYAWDQESDGFVLKSQEPIPSESVERKFIESVLTDKPEQFESYIEGLWRKEGNLDDEPTLVYFAPAERRISIHSKTEKQTWDWGRSNPSYAGIYTALVNSGVPDMVRILGVDLLGRDKIRLLATAGQAVRFPIREDWNGIYTRVQGRREGPPGSLQSVPVDSGFFLPLEDSSETIYTELSAIAGEYAAPDGFVITLSSEAFSYREGMYTYRGAFPLYSYAGRLLLDFEVQDSRTIPAGRRSFFISIGKDDSGRGRIILKPAKFSAQGVEQLFKPSLVFSSRSEDQGSK
jgi:hypothetical protein